MVASYDLYEKEIDFIVAFEVAIDNGSVQFKSVKLKSFKQIET